MKTTIHSLTVIVKNSHTRTFALTHQGKVNNFVKMVQTNHSRCFDCVVYSTYHPYEYVDFTKNNVHNVIEKENERMECIDVGSSRPGNGEEIIIDFVKGKTRKGLVFLSQTCVCVCRHVYVCTFVCMCYNRTC